MKRQIRTPLAAFRRFRTSLTNKLKKELVRLKLRKRGSFADSTWLSLVLRPFLEADRIKTMLGAPLLMAALGGGVLTLPTTDDALASWDVADPLPKQVLELTVEPPSNNSDVTYLVPVTHLTGISQYYHAGHPGIDLRAPLGTDVVAMDNGLIEEIIDSRFGYGRHVLVSHANGTITLYAHLGLITVEEGEQIRAGDKIGEIGMTGRTTGPHLHFEVRRSTSTDNPLVYLRKSLALVSTQASR